MISKNIKLWIKNLKEGEIFFAKEVYIKYFSDYEELTFYQLLIRFYKYKLINKIDKGFYFKPYHDDYDLLPEKEKILNKLTNSFKNGSFGGMYLLKNKGLVVKDIEDIIIYTDQLDIKTFRNIDIYTVKTLHVDYESDLIIQCLTLFELLESLDNFDESYFDKNNIFQFISEFCSSYNEKVVMRFMMSKKIKKKYIFELVNILDYFTIKNNLSNLINTKGVYKVSKIIKQLFFDTESVNTNDRY